MDENTRIALIAVIVKEDGDVTALNGILHRYSPWIIGRMGLPYRTRKLSIISLAVDAPQPKIAALSGELGRLKGVSTKTVYAPEDV